MMLLAGWLLHSIRLAAALGLALVAMPADGKLKVV
jgi:hypothetical protein